MSAAEVRKIEEEHEALIPEAQRPDARKHAWTRLLESIREDARDTPTSYLADAIVPEGGE